MKAVSIALFATIVLLFSCASTQTAASMGEDLTASQIIQRAQEASDAGDFEGAVALYRLAIERYPSDMNVVVQCEYEIAFIHYKMGLYDLAEQELKALLERFATDKTGRLPLAYKRLAEIVLEKIAEKKN